MKTLLIIYKFFSRGGAQRDLVRTALALQKRGAAVTVLCAEAVDPLPEGCTLQLLRVQGGSNHSRMIDFERKTGEFLQHNRFDAVLGFARMKHLDMYFAADDCLLTRWQNKLLNFFLPRRRTFLRLERSALQSPVIFSLTARQERDYRRYYHTPQDKFKRMPPGIDRKYQTFERSEEVRLAVRKKYAVNEDKLLFVQAAASFRTKGVDRVLAMLGALPEGMKKRIVFIAAGDDRHRARFAKLAEMLHLEVHFPGGIDNLEELYAAADLMIHPARNEATGTVLAEALCCSLPVLTTDRCGYAEFISSSGGGVILPEPFTLEHWTLALQKLIAEPEHLAQCRKNIEGMYKNDFWYSRPDVIADEVMKFAAARQGAEIK